MSPYPQIGNAPHLNPIFITWLMERPPHLGYGGGNAARELVLHALRSATCQDPAPAGVLYAPGCGCLAAQLLEPRSTHWPDALLIPGAAAAFSSESDDGSPGAARMIPAPLNEPAPVLAVPDTVPSDLRRPPGERQLPVLPLTCRILPSPRGRPALSACVTLIGEAASMAARVEDAINQAPPLPLHSGDVMVGAIARIGCIEVPRHSPADELGLRLISPLQLMHAKQQVTCPEFDILARSITRRMELLRSCYGRSPGTDPLPRYHPDPFGADSSAWAHPEPAGTNPTPSSPESARSEGHPAARAVDPSALGSDPRDLLAKTICLDTTATRIRSVSWTYSSLSKCAPIRYHGVVGRLVYRGDVSPWIELLTLMTHVGLGKGTAMGMGNVEIDDAESVD